MKINILNHEIQLPVEIPEFECGVLDVVGLGVRFPQQLTLEAISVLSCAHKIYSIESPTHYASWPNLEQRVNSLEYVFDQHKLREDALKAATQLIAQAAMSNAGVVWALGGHPTVAVSPFLHLVDISTDLGLRVRVQPGISSVATFFAEQGIDPCGQGIQILRGRSTGALTNALPVVVVCPGYARDCQVYHRLRELALMTRDLIDTYGADALFRVLKALPTKSDVIDVRAIDLIKAIKPSRLGQVMVAGPVEFLEGKPRRAIYNTAHKLDPRET